MNESFGIRIGTPEPARLWSGVGDLDIPADGIEDAPARYLGGGELLSAPDFQQLVNGIAERLDIQVSGVSAETLRLALEDAPDVKGADVHLVTFLFDDNWQLVSVSYEALFRADNLLVDSKPDENGRVRTLTLSIGSDNTSRSRGELLFFTDAHQRRRSPDDAIFSHVGTITVGKSRRFGPAQ